MGDVVTCIDLDEWTIDYQICNWHSHSGNSTDAISIANVNSKGVSVNGLARTAESGEAREEFVNEERKRVRYIIQWVDGILCPLAVVKCSFSIDIAVGVLKRTTHSSTDSRDYHRIY